MQNESTDTHWTVQSILIAKRRMARVQTTRLAGILLFVSLSAACFRTPAPEPSDDEYVIQHEPVDTNSCKFCAFPAQVRTCEVHKGVRTRLYWHLIHAGAQVVDIYVVDDAGKEQQFAQQPAEGSIETGPWLKPGLTFVVKDHENGKKMAELVIAGTSCHDG